jgi:hypothetical protein
VTSAEQCRAGIAATDFSPSAYMLCPASRSPNIEEIVANLRALLGWWAEQGMVATADEMQHLFRSTVNPTLLPAITE